MENFQNPHGATQQTDAYGNPIRGTDELGNPTFQSGQTTGATGFGAGHEQGKLHRSGSSSSSSSEDDGQGGRRKKGMKEKIKEKLPGTGAHKDQQTHTTATGGDLSGGTHEKKGIMDKIKEKLPGGGHHDDHQQNY